MRRDVAVGPNCIKDFDEGNKDYQEYLKWLNGYMLKCQTTLNT